MIKDRRGWTPIVVAALVTAGFLPLFPALLGVRYSYTLRVVTLGGSLLGLVSGVLGSFAVLRRQSLLGDALSHAALPGVAAAFLLAGRSLPALLLGAGVASWLGLLFVRLLTRRTRIKEDAAMGIVLAVWFAAGIAGLTYIQGRPDASQAGLDTFIFGQAAAVGRSDILLIALVGAAAFLVVGVFWKEFKLVTFDPEFAGANGFRVDWLTGVLIFLLVVAVVLGLQMAGVVLMVGLLIAPGVAARQWTDRLEQMIVLAGLFGAFAGGTGAVISAVDRDIPTGPTIIVVSFLLVALSIAAAPGRGVVWSLLRRRRDRKRFAARNVMRDLYHYAYDHGDAEGAVPDSFISGLRGHRGTKGLRTLLSSGLARKTEEGDTGVRWRLTEKGAQVAAVDARNQRLWDLYRELRDQLDLPTVAEERDRDIRAVLPEETVDTLSNLLGEKGAEPRVRN
ncbi:MAG: iron chelate uptake ABC transporter family permease subunit [Spirochaetota bacterium]